jgi:hypothetical protein
VLFCTRVEAGVTSNARQRFVLSLRAGHGPGIANDCRLAVVAADAEAEAAAGEVGEP